MRQSFLVLSFLSLTAALQAEDRSTLLMEPGLLDPTTATALHQSDFDSGTYRIQQSGYYYLAEDIVFEPNNGSRIGVDRPQIGWFTAISVECDNVVIDLNTKTLEVSQSFIETQTCKVYSHIELGNSPFKPFLDFAFTDVTEFKGARNVVVRNGVLGNSSHHGIHGNDNFNCRFYDLLIRDWEVAAIGLNGFQCGEIRNVIISGPEHEVPFTGLRPLHNLLKLDLEKLVNDGNTGAQTHLNVINSRLADPNKNGTNQQTLKLPDGNMYGILLNRELNVGTIHEPCNEITTDGILIEDVTVCNLKNEVLQVVSMRDGNGNVLADAQGFVLRWEDAYPSGSFAPNDLLKAQVYATNALNPSLLPAGFAANILAATPNETTFKNQVTPHFAGDLRNHTNKGIFGIRLDCCHGVTLNRCKVISVESFSQPGQELSSLPGHSHYPSLEQERSVSGDVHGIILKSCKGCVLNECSVSKCTSEHGYVYGIMLLHDSSSNKIINCCSGDHVTKHDSTSSVVNPSARVYGFYFDDVSNANEVVNCASNSLVAPRTAHGFCAYSSVANTFEDCRASNIKVTASTALSSAAKSAVGFRSAGSSGTLFDRCHAFNVHCTGESSESSQSASRALGFLLDDADSHAVIHESVARCNNGGAGTSAGVMVASGVDGAAVKRCSLESNVCEAAPGVGYGLKATNADSTLILANVAYGNKTSNYDVSYAISGHSLPLSVASYSDVSSLNLVTNWNNISLDPDAEVNRNRTTTIVMSSQ